LFSGAVFFQSHRGLGLEGAQLDERGIMLFFIAIHHQRKP
jgi:hypothetical protein